MTPRLDLDDLLNILFENACIDFHKTPQYSLLCEKQTRIDEDCKSILAPDDRNFVQECFEIIENINGEQMEFVYHTGLRDCVKILKKLEIL